MIKLENKEIVGLEAAIRGMRNPMNSWDRSDSRYCGAVDYPDDSCENCEYFDDLCMASKLTPYKVGPNDHDLMMRLVNGGPVHAKFRRMIVVYLDITAPLYWWKEFDTYKVGTVANSCSTMHKIHEKEFTLEDFSCEHLLGLIENPLTGDTMINAQSCLDNTISYLNVFRRLYLETKDKEYWWQMIQLLPSSYNQKRTVMLSYEVLANIYKWRKNHKLDEWREFCEWIEKLPYSEVITGEVEE